MAKQPESTLRNGHLISYASQSATTLCQTQHLIAMFTKACDWALLGVTWTQSSLHKSLWLGPVRSHMDPVQTSQKPVTGPCEESHGASTDFTKACDWALWGVTWTQSRLHKSLWLGPVRSHMEPVQPSQKPVTGPCEESHGPSPDFTKACD
jgi:hypothetical protein